MASSSSSSFHHTPKKHDVFISFRGTDTRDNFTSHLHSAFRRKNIRSYLDEDSLQQGDEISPALMKAIQESRICVVILSENYANSSWCLEELAHIIQRMELGDLIVMPVFYRVAQSDVREQQGSFGAAFDGLRERRQKRRVEQSDVGLPQRGSCGVESDALDEQFEQWRKALRAVADIWGWGTAQIRPDAKLIEEIVNVIWKRLYDMASSDHLLQGLVGVDKRCEMLESLLHLDTSDDVRVVGIVGMGGLGKTTLARVAYNRFSSVFEGSCFLENVKQKSRDMGNTELQKHLFSQLLKDNSFNEVNQFVITRLRSVKVLVILDDVDDVDQLEQLVGNRSWFFSGSRIMITTRDMQVLNNIGCQNVYNLHLLDDEESMELFSSKAFHAKCPTSDFINLSVRVVNYAKGNPLALKVLGSHLYSKGATIWESELKKLERIPNKKIHDVMKISYDGLDQNEQDIFLDIAHFFTDVNKSLVEKQLSACGRFVDTGIRGLIDKSILTINYNRFVVHDLLQEMAIQIVREESPEPGKRSRLCLTEEIHSVLKNNTGTGVVQGISLRNWKDGLGILVDPLIFQKMNDLRYHKFGGTGVVQGISLRNWKDGLAIRVDPLIFQKMNNLRYLKFGDNTCIFPEGIHFLPDTLSILHWIGYPSKAFPSEFTPNHLVELNMGWSLIERLWSGTPRLEGLKVLNLENCKNLIELPDLTHAINLEILDLLYCERLYNLPDNIGNLKSLKRFKLSHARVERVPPSINCLSRLEHLELSSCKRLKILPINTGMLMNLLRLILADCSNLEIIPEIQETKNLFLFFIHGTGIRKLSKSIENLTAILALDFSNCLELECVPSEIYNLNLLELNFSGCSKLTSLPSFSGGFESLVKLDLSQTGIVQVPEWVFSLPWISSLNLSETNIERIPESITSSDLSCLKIILCQHLRFLPELPPSLVELNAAGCISMTTVSFSSGRHNDTNVNESFLFWRCFMMDSYSIQEEFLNRSSHSKEVGIELGAGGSVVMCYQGDQIPEWWPNQNEGCSINFSGHYLAELIFCMVVEKFDDDEKEIEEDDLCPQIWIETFNGPDHFIKHRILCPSINVINSDHVIMFYKGYDGRENSSAFEVSLDTRIDISVRFDWRWSYKVKRCGYGLIQSPCTKTKQSKRTIGSEFCTFDKEQSTSSKKNKIV